MFLADLQLTESSVRVLKALNAPGMPAGKGGTADAPQPGRGVVRAGIASPGRLCTAAPPREGGPAPPPARRWWKNSRRSAGNAMPGPENWNCARPSTHSSGPWRMKGFPSLPSPERAQTRRRARSSSTAPGPPSLTGIGYPPLGGCHREPFPDPVLSQQGDQTRHQLLRGFHQNAGGVLRNPGGSQHTGAAAPGAERL